MIKNVVMSELLRISKVDGANSTDATQTKGTTFKINSIKLYAPVVTLFVNDNTKFFENIK